MKAAISLLAVLVISSGYFINDSFAAIPENQAFLLEGSGFAVTEESIKISEIDLGLYSLQQRGSSIDFQTDNGFITIDNDEYLVSELEGKFLREGKYIRLNGNVESSSGLDTPISFFGRLVEESRDAAVYGFTGRITASDDTYKIIYTAKLSALSKIKETSTEDKKSEDKKSEDIVLYILRGSSNQGVKSPDNPNDKPFVSIDDFGGFKSKAQLGNEIAEQAIYQQPSDGHLKLRYFSQDRIEVPPGSTITIVNDDLVSHSVLSGKENYSGRYDGPTGKYTSDLQACLDESFSEGRCGDAQRIDTGDIAPGESTTITFGDAGFYRLYDPDYQWMGIIAYVFPTSDSIIIKDYGKPKN
jgi:plastocyanin